MFVRATAVCSPTIRRPLLPMLLTPWHTVFAVPALEAAAQIEVTCLLFCVMSD